MSKEKRREEEKLKALEAAAEADKAMEDAKKTDEEAKKARKKAEKAVDAAEKAVDKAAEAKEEAKKPAKKAPAKKTKVKVEKVEKIEEKPEEKPAAKPAKVAKTASDGKPFERSLKEMNNRELTEALYEFAVRSFEWQDKADDKIEEHDEKLEDHEKRLKKLEEKPEPEPEPAKVQVQPLVKNESKLEGIRFPYADGPCSKLWLWWNAETKEWCGPTDIHTADKLSAKVPEKAFVWLKDGYVMRKLTDKEIAEYFG